MLYEYFDDALSDDVRAAAREHLGQCDDCRRALLREKTVAKSIRNFFDCATWGLSIRPGMHRRVLAALESKPAPSDTWVGAWKRLRSIPCQPIGAAALLSVLLVFLGIQSHRQGRQDPGLRSTAHGYRDTCVIDVPMQIQTRVFRRQNDAVVDTMVSNLAIGHAHFADNSERQSKPR